MFAAHWKQNALGVHWAPADESAPGRDRLLARFKSRRLWKFGAERPQLRRHQWIAQRWPFQRSQLVFVLRRDRQQESIRSRRAQELNADTISVLRWLRRQ